MKSKLLTVLGVTVLTLGIGTAAYAAGGGLNSFNEMLPFMKQMHPQMNDSELEQMYNNCHQREGNTNFRGMMRNAL